MPAPRPMPGGALSALISKTRAVLGADVLRGRTELSLTPPRAGPCRECGSRPVPVAFRRVGRGSGRLAAGVGAGLERLVRRAPDISPEAEAPWAETWRRRLTDVRIRALESLTRKPVWNFVAPSCTGRSVPPGNWSMWPRCGNRVHLLLMRTALAAGGNVAEALAAYERLRILLREELGVDPGEAVQEEYVRLLGSEFHDDVSPGPPQRCRRMLQHDDAEQTTSGQSPLGMSVRYEFDQAANVVDRRCLCQGGVIAGKVSQDESDDLIAAPIACDVAAFASDLPEHQDSSSYRYLTQRRRVGNADVMEESARVQLCGAFAVELRGRRIDNMLPGRQGRLLFAYLVLYRLQPVSRSTLIDALWGDDQPADAGGALSAVISKTRAVVGRDVLRGRTELTDGAPRSLLMSTSRSPCRCCTPPSLPSLSAPGNGRGRPLTVLCSWPAGRSCPRPRRLGPRPGVSRLCRCAGPRTGVPRGNVFGARGPGAAGRGACRPRTCRDRPVPRIGASAPDACACGTRQRG